MLDEGKRLRAKSFLLFSGDSGERSLNIATAIELLHAATLIHDDILDNSKLRRGRPPLYARRGVSTGLLYGDYLFSLAFSLIAELNDTEVYKHMAAALKAVLEGEIMENRRRGDISLTREEYLSIAEKKSGVLFGLACRLGAMARGLDGECREVYT